MKCNILKLYTEKLDILSFQNFIEEDLLLELIVNFNSSIKKTDSDYIKLVKMDYSVHASNAPISLNWTGIAILKFEEIPPDDLNAESFLDNDPIKEFIESSIEHFSFLIGGDLPNIYNLRKDNDND